MQRIAFTYTVLDPDGTRCLGCVYVFPAHATFLAKSAVTPLGDDAWADVDAAVFFWVRRSRMEAGMDERLLTALRAWFEAEWKLNKTVYVTSESFTQQVDLLGRTGLDPKFEMREPGKPFKRLMFG